MNNWIKPNFKKQQQFIFGKKKFLKNKPRRKIFSGLNTYNTYMNKKTDNRFLILDESRGSLVSILKLLSLYIDDISRIVPGGSYHDINLEARMNIKKYESASILSYDSQYDFKPVFKNLIFFFRVLKGFFEFFIQIQDRWDLNNNLSGFFCIITKEKFCVEQLYEFFDTLFSDYRINTELLSSWNRTVLDFNGLLTDCLAEQDLMSNGNLSVEILDLLQNINNKNRFLRNYLDPFFLSVIELNEHKSLKTITTTGCAL